MTTFSTSADVTTSPSLGLPAPWMPLEALSDLWAAFGREVSGAAAARATGHAFAALADEREAVHLFNWLAPSRLPATSHASAVAEASLSSQLMGQEAVIEALSRAATHWYDAARALLDLIEPPVGEHVEQADSSASDLERLLGSTLAQRLRVWAIAHSLLADQHRHLFPTQHEPQAGGNQPC